MSRCASLIVTASLLVLGLTSGAQAGGYIPHWYTHYDRAAHHANNTRPWHHVYGHWQYGQPVALVVPPTANMMTQYSWGVGRTRMSPINHQFGRPVPAPGAGGSYYPTPAWPSDTVQFGVYPVRAPW